MASVSFVKLALRCFFRNVNLSCRINLEPNAKALDMAFGRKTTVANTPLVDRERSACIEVLVSQSMTRCVECSKPLEKYWAN